MHQQYTRADVLCLQDVDFFHQWWSPQLSSAGYDSLFKQRTSRAAVHQEGVVIAWKRDVFDLFRSEEMELNRCVLHLLHGILGCERPHLALISASSAAGRYLNSVGNSFN